jgi:O6-methylguanine-DNA--protein-cysteine methyltransferase
MERDLQWIITRVDGKIASVSTDYKGAARVLAGIAALPPARVGSVDCRKITTDEVFSLSDSVTWDDLLLLGTPFQKSVWKALFDLTHGPEPARLLSYTQLAESLGKGPGVRAVAHALSLHPVAVSHPPHLIMPKESLERLHGL